MTIASKELSGISAAEKTPASSQELTYFRTLIYAAIVGAAGGLVATVYYFVLEQLLEVVWESGRESILGWFPAWLPHWHYTWIVATLGGLGVGLCLHFLGLPGEMAIVIDLLNGACQCYGHHHTVDGTIHAWVCGFCFCCVSRGARLFL